MRQVPGLSISVPVITAVPVASEGADMTQFLTAAKVFKYALYLHLVGGTSCNVTPYVRRANDDTWYLLTTIGTLGVLGSALLTPGNYVFKLEDIGIFDEIVLRKTNDTGLVAVTAELQEYIENNFTRGD